MATYSKDKGLKVKSYTEDPSNLSPSAWEGKLYYNSSDGQFKFQTLGTGAWASSNNLNATHYASAGGGIQTAAFSVGGQAPGPPYAQDHHEQYNGTSWTEAADLNTARAFYTGTCSGTQTAGLVTAGEKEPWSTKADETETWNGSAWSETGDVNTARGQLANCGTTTAALAAGGEDPSGTVAIVESFNGTSWTEVGDMPTGGKGGSMVGTSTASIYAGSGSAPKSLTEVWNGSAWTEGSNLNTDRYYSGGSGISTLSVTFAGFQGGGPKTANTEQWDGSSWTEVADLATARAGGASSSAGTSITSLFAGGDTGPGAITEEWTTTHTLKKVTTG